MNKSYYPNFKNLIGLFCTAMAAIAGIGTTAQAQIVTGVTPLSGIPSSASVTISGSGFNATDTNNVVYFGQTRGTVTSASASSLTVQVPVGASFDPITVLNRATRLIGNSVTPFKPGFDNTCFIPNSLNFKPRFDLTSSSTNYVYIAQLGDLDGDGKPDVVTANHSTVASPGPSISVFKNNSTPGSLNYAYVSNLAPQGRPANIKLADLDGDGKLDIIVAVDNSVAICVFHNLSTPGTIAFSARQTYRASASNGVQEVSIADFDGDGKNDIACVVPADDSVKVLRNVISGTVGSAFGSGDFAAYLSFKSGQIPTTLATADIDNDGKVDIVTGSGVGGSGMNNYMSVLRNTTIGSSITFATHSDFYIANDNTAIEVQTGDLDNDGRQEAFVTTQSAGGTSYLSVFRNTSTPGTVAFATTVGNYTPASVPVGVTAADVNGDGKLDLIVVDNSTAQVKILRNTHTGGNFTASSFASGYAINVASGPIAVTVGDADMDKKPDIFVGCSNSGSGYVSILRNYPLPYVDTIRGNVNVCMSSTTDTMHNTVGGGYWTSTNTSRAMIDAATGVITPVSAGADTIIYTVVCQGDTNTVRKAITILALPTVSVTTGPVSVCSSNTITLSNGTSGGAWSSSNTSIATVSTGGVVYGVAVGNAIISYTVTNSCGSVSDTQMVRVNQTPGAITGVAHQCVGTSTFLSNAFSGGTWSSSAISIATVSTGGMVFGVSAGYAVITYTMPGGCYVTIADTVGSSGSAGTLSGATSVCSGATVTYSSTVSGGTWSSGSTSVATVSATGDVYGVSAGTATISYTVSSACGPVSTFRNITVYTQPGAITGSSTICSGTSTTLSASPSGGSWTTSDASIAAPSGSTVTGGATTGTATITYTLTGGCYSTFSMTVNPSPVAISGSASVCVGFTTTYTDATSPGTWSVSSTTPGTIDAATGVYHAIAAGTAVVSYTSTTYSCTVTRTVTVNNNPGAISGPTSVCSGATISLSDSPTPGTWTSTFPAVGSVTSTGAGSATVTGGVAGTTTVTYSVSSTGCYATTTITTLPVPSAIIGSATVCLNATDSLADTTAGGTWSSVSPSVASVTASGVVRPVSTGTSSIRYTLSTGCYAALSVTVNPIPAAITGPSTVCPGFGITLSDASASGIWTSADTNIAQVISGTGAVTGMAAGTVNISYSYVATGCGVAMPVTVYPAPMAITGPAYLCRGYNATFADSTTGGRWSSSNTSIATVDSMTGVTRGLITGTITLTYTTSTYGCAAFRTVTVNPVVTPTVSLTLSTPTTICAGTAVTFTANPVNGGTAPTYDWRINGVPSSTGPTLTYLPLNLDTVYVKIRSNAVCAIPDSAKVGVRMTVNPLLTPGVNITNSSSRDTLCTGAAVTFTPSPVNGGTAPTYRWYVNGVLVWLGTPYSYFPANGDVISVIMNSNVTCRVRDTAINSHTLTVSPYVTPTVTMLGSDTACEGYPNVLHAVSTYPGVSPTYAWYTNGALVAGATGTYFSPVLNDRDFVQVKMTSSWPCVITPNANSNVDTMTVIQVDTPIVRLDVFPGWILSAGSTAWFQATATGVGAHPTYRWFKNSIPIAGATSNVYNTNAFASGDSFVVRVTNNDVCSGIMAFDYIRLIIGDNVGVNEVSKGDADVQILPNPNSGSFVIKGITDEAVNEDVDVQITNMVGQVVYTGTMHVENGQADARITLEDVTANGIYMANLQSAHISKVVRFVVNK